MTHEQVKTLDGVVYKLENQDYAQMQRFRDIKRKAQLVKEAGVTEAQRVLLNEVIDLAEAGAHDEKQDDHNHGVLRTIVDKIKEIFR